MADVMCVNHAAYDGDDRQTMAVSVDQQNYVLPNMPYHNNPGVCPYARIIGAESHQCCLPGVKLRSADGKWP